MRLYRRIIGWSMLLAVLLMGCPLGAGAESMHQEVENPAFTLEVELGWSGAITYGKTFPITVTVRNGGGEFAGWLGVNAYVSQRQYNRYETQVTLPAGSAGRYVLPVTVYTRQDTFTLELTEEDGTVVRSVNVRPDQVINPSAMLVGVLSSRPDSCANLNITRDSDTLSRYEYWQAIALDPDTFPEDQEMLNSFGLLAVDDIDLGSLSDRGQEALLAWLGAGHILIVGGGARAESNLRCLGQELHVGLPERVTGVPAALEAYFGLNATGSALETSVTRLTGVDPLIADEEGNGLVWRLPVGNGVLYATAFETGDARLNAAPILHTLWQRLLVQQDLSLYHTIQYYSRLDYVSTSNAEYTLRLDGSARVIPAVLIVAGGIALGVLAWVLLKRKDRQVWLWGILPLIALLGGLAIGLLGATSPLTRPAALSITTLAQDTEGRVKVLTAVTVATPETGFHRVSSPAGALRENTYSYVDYDDDEDSKVQEPTQLMNNYRTGADSSLGLRMTTPWETRHLVLADPFPAEGRVNASLWMEEDGIHGEIQNGTAYALEPGYVVTGYGFADIPALAPGEKISFVMTRAQVPGAGQAIVWEPGKMYENNTYGFYTFLWEAVNRNTTRPTNQPASPEQEQTYNLFEAVRNQLSSSGNSAYSNYYSGNDVTESYYFARTAAPETAEIRLDGEPVGQRKDEAVYGVCLTWLDIGKTGVVYRGAGTDKPILCLKDAEGMPAGDDSTNRNWNWYTLTDEPVFRFDLSAFDQVEWQRMVVSVYTYADGLELAILNPWSRGWKTIEQGTEIEEPNRYVDAAGQVYLRLSAGASTESYAESNAPQLTLEGRVRDHAGNQ